MVYAVFGLICVGLLGACLFTTGIIFSMMPLVAAGIAILALSILGMLVYYVYCQQPTVQGQGTIQGSLAYTTNNMNTMKRQQPLQPSAFSTKRNKSDTDLELMSRQTESEV